ncbi:MULTISPECIES: NADH:ubiquinone oxidoreductase subunit NDUFA12 [Halocynthiibacter]|uniref:NADH:ubiquinone oxidoreductase subunit NDUFA12 n=1 Tax=Halocynthiibacter halioticoli TaxID=2986804 RepID=A0AAE3LQU6_9RHOB|nr:MULTISPECIES: NADH:ubiquinone oxidoreductase subunit NDUFA12 [Halocynthiibacter]MCV6823918.1 NADH:ubiquinone oxidoreductase subunit NDUFA12 [Halocynthiibacter halioticoli]MCW4056919.1 NADH:ubiquinone oxidoreductase subunit NDUFA12 [Halocynthiibacter sp. SDUM655004]
MRFILSLLTWWNNETLGMRFFTWRKGEQVGEDEQGNRYYQNKDGSRRWVIYNGNVEASRISPDWHGWLHFTWNETPKDAPLAHKDWEKPLEENATGTLAAYAPAGSMRRPEPAVRSDYEAWQPE